MKDLLTSATDSALAVQFEDLDIAGNQLKISAWLATIATAGLYFCFNGSNSKHQYVYLIDSLSYPLFYPYVAISFIFGLSLITAYQFHIVHNHFTALSKNVICGYKIQHSVVLQAIDSPEFIETLKQEKKPFWALVTTGVLWSLAHPGTENYIEVVLSKIAVCRGAVDSILTLQKGLTLTGFILLIIANAYFSIH